MIQSEREGTVSSVGTRLSAEVRPWAGLVRDSRPRFANGLLVGRGCPKTQREASQEAE
jgi:hypothetical protein